MSLGAEDILGLLVVVEHSNFIKSEYAYIWNWRCP